MIEPNYEEILKKKIDYYGDTRAAYQFTAEEFTRQYIELNNLSIQIVSQQSELLYFIEEVAKWDESHSSTRLKLKAKELLKYK